MPIADCPTYVGIDPGGHGAIAVTSGAGVRTFSLDRTDREIADVLFEFSSGSTCAMIEQQDPRPTFWKGRASILRSTCILYGRYHFLRGLLVAYQIPFDEVRPKKWQAEYIGKKKESDADRKRRLKSKAQELFPGLKVTLSNADALLIAEYCRRIPPVNLSTGPLGDRRIQ